jgi:pimeloyl-ACP methyl ester carboxylesterase
VADAPDIIYVPSTNSVSVAVHNLGGSGEPLVILHATGFHGRAYAPMANVLKRHFQVWAVDLRGHGATNAPDNGDFAWNGMVNDLLCSVEALGIGPFHAFGHSMGGAVTLAAEVARPGLLQSAFVFEPIVMNPDWLVARGGVNPMSGPARKRREIFPNRAEAMARYASRMPLGLLRADALWAYVEHGFVDLPDGTVQLACRGESEARTFEGNDKITVAEVAGITTPITVAAGTISAGDAPDRLAEPLARALPRGRFVSYPFVGHFGPFQEPERIAADVLAAIMSNAG